MTADVLRRVLYALPILAGVNVLTFMPLFVPPAAVIVRRCRETAL